MLGRIDHADLRLAALHRDDVAVGVDAESIGTVAVFEERRDAAIGRDARDAIGRRLGEHEAAVGQAERSLGAVEAFLDEFDFGPRGDDAFDRRRHQILSLGMPGPDQRGEHARAQNQRGRRIQDVGKAHRGHAVGSGWMSADQRKGNERASEPARRCVMRGSDRKPFSQRAFSVQQRQEKTMSSAPKSCAARAAVLASQQDVPRYC